MDTTRPSRRTRLRAALAGGAGLVIGLATGGALLFGSARHAAGDANPLPSLDPARLIDATHVPPLITVPGEAVTLRYDVYCPAPEDGAGDACDGAGTVYARAGTAGAFRALPLQLDPKADEGRYAVRLPESIAASPTGFSYYAILRNQETGVSMTLPPAGASAPQRSFRAAAPVDVDLGVHPFGTPRPPAQRLLDAPWGDGPGEAGLEGGPGTTPVGPGAFTVAADGTVTLLDQVHHQALALEPGATAPSAVPLAVNGTLADLAVDATGDLWVLETAGRGAPLLRGFGPKGALERVVPVAARTASQVRIGPAGPVVKQLPSEQWVPAVEDGVALGSRAQGLAAESARPVSRTRDVVVLREDDEVRVAIVGRSGVDRAWRLHSSTPLGEVQLAEPYADGVVVVVRSYTDDRSEFTVARLGSRGLVSSFSVAAADWAETAPLSRFRLAGSSVYRLGSTPAGVSVDRFELEVR
jgi:hypothetical protein